MNYSELINEIYHLKSSYTIEYLIDTTDKTGFSAEENAVLKEILDMRDLDEIHLKCCVVMGNDEKADELRAWIIQKKKRNQGR